jgi:hypothetical protein
LYNPFRAAAGIYGYYFATKLTEHFYAFFFAYSLLVIFKEFQDAFYNCKCAN